MLTVKEITPPRAGRKNHPTAAETQAQWQAEAAAHRATLPRNPKPETRAVRVASGGGCITLGSSDYADVRAQARGEWHDMTGRQRAAFGMCENQYVAAKWTAFIKAKQDARR